MDSWLDRLAVPALANALGTLGAALVLFTLAVIAGLVDDVSLRAWITVAAGTGTLGAAVLLVRRESRHRAQRRTADGEGMLNDLHEHDPEVFALVSLGRQRQLTLDESERLVAALLPRGSAAASETQWICATLAAVLARAR